MLPIGMMGMGGFNSETAFPMMQTMALNPGMGSMMGMGRGSDCCDFSGMMGEGGMMGACQNPMMSLIMGGGNAAGQNYWTMMAQAILAQVAGDPSSTASMFGGMPGMAFGGDPSSMLGSMPDLSGLMGGLGGGMDFSSMLGGMGGGMDFSSLLGGLGGGMDFSSMLGGVGEGLGSIGSGIGDAIGSLF